MFLTKAQPTMFHVGRDLALIILSVLFLPLSILIVIVARVLAAASFISKPVIQPKYHNGHRIRVLVTGVGMAKGLFLARSLYLGGCIVISGDFEKNGVPVCGRFSRAVSKFYRLGSPVGKGSLDSYISQILGIIKDEKIDLWVSCSGVATAMEDAKLMQIIEDKTSCKAFQFNEDATLKLDNKYEFMRTTANLGLTVPQWGFLTSPKDADNVLSHSNNLSVNLEPREFILKNVSMDDRTRGSLPLLSADRPKQMLQVLESLDYKDASWIIQQFVPGNEEYCTQSLVINGHVRAFIACPSASVLMHYTLLQASSPLFQAMLRFTQTYATGMYARYGHFSGHLSFDFLALNEPTVDGIKKTLLPIECNPRCHTAVVHFRDNEKALTGAYASLLPSENGSGPSDTVPDLIIGPSNKTDSGYYWIAHDLVVLFVLPIFQLFLASIEFRDMLNSHLDFWKHVTLWRDPTFEWWDSLPWFVLNHVYWPGQLLMVSLHGTRWSQINVSTGKIFVM
ncbi:hypothetical protein MMC10_005515 [Thelotrema lepadinum]|nr:hypothetical protein [Thelotrema lepadinum]